MLKENLVKFLEKEGYDYLLVNSTNEFLVEYNSLEQNARYYLTGFSGSTGEALLSRNGSVRLFVDGRYHAQADKQAYKGVEVVKLELGESFISNLVQKIAPNSRIAITAGKIPLNFYNSLKTALEGTNVEIVPLNFDPVFRFIEPQQSKFAKIIDIPLEITGISTEEKITSIQEGLDENEAILVTNLEEIAWILNKRSFAHNFSSTFNARLAIEKSSYKVFYENSKNGGGLKEYQNYLKTAEKRFLYAPKSLSYGDYLLIKNKSSEWEGNKIEKAKSVKNEAEIEHMKRCFNRTDIVVSKVSGYVNTADMITEQELVKFVEKEFYAQGATSLSFNTILASGKNSALAHYSADMSVETKIKEGNFVLLDCGAYFEGGYSTDITRVFCFGEPNEASKRVYTTVLRAFLNAYHIGVKEGLCGFEIDKTAREVIENANLEDFSFNHATGHGVGISVHEFPPSISSSELAKAPLRDGMTFTIEPGAYNPDFGGVRLENSVYFKNGVIQSFSKVKFEEKLINYDMLNEREKIWLKEWQKGI